MTQEKDSKQSIISVSGSNNAVINTTDNEKISEKKSVSGQSSAKQLLTLAKAFAIDGSLLPPEKQMPLQERADRRAYTNSQRQQLNLESIVVKAVNYCSTSTIAEQVDADWFAQYTELAKEVSNKTMQELWAKILSKEINTPGSFAIKTLKVFKGLSIHDAKLFAKATAIAMRDNTGKQYRIISGSYQTPSIWNSFDKKRVQNIDLSKLGLHYSDLLTLAENALLFTQETETAPFEKGQELGLIFQGKPIVLRSVKNNAVLKYYKLSPAGCELARLIAEKPDEDTRQSIVSNILHHFTSNA